MSATETTEEMEIALQNAKEAHERGVAERVFLSKGKSPERFAHRCAPEFDEEPSVMAIEGRDIGEWDDSHPLNNSNTSDAEYARLFAT